MCEISRMGVSNCFAISFDLDLQYNLRQGWRHVFTGDWDHYNWKKLNNAGEACDVVIKVFKCIKIAWDGVGNMFVIVLRSLQLYGDQDQAKKLDMIFES